MPFDQESLLEEYEDDKDILKRMVEIFDRDAAERLPKIRQAVESGDAGTLMAEAHAIKGGLGTFFANDSFQTAYKLENMGHDNSLSEAAATLATFETELQTFRKAIGDLIDS